MLCHLPALAAAAGECAGLEGAHGWARAVGPLPAYFCALLSLSAGPGSEGTMEQGCPALCQHGFFSSLFKAPASQGDVLQSWLGNKEEKVSWDLLFSTEEKIPVEELWV